MGDNLSTDIMFGNQCGIDTLLVLSGVTTAEKAEYHILQSKTNPDYNSDPNLDKEGVPTYV